MHPSEHPVCEWSGVSPDDPDRIIECGKAAIGFAPDSAGRRIYACEEHVGWAKERAGTGEFIQSTRPVDTRPPLTPHAASKFDRHNAPVVGTTDLEEN